MLFSLCVFVVLLFGVACSEYGVVVCCWLVLSFSVVVDRCCCLVVLCWCVLFVFGVAVVVTVV